MRRDMPSDLAQLLERPAATRIERTEHGDHNVIEGVSLAALTASHSPTIRAATLGDAYVENLRRVTDFTRLALVQHDRLGQ
jgi:hypothetical protein